MPARGAGDGGRAPGRRGARRTGGPGGRGDARPTAGPAWPSEGPGGGDPVASEGQRRDPGPGHGPHRGPRDAHRAGHQPFVGHLHRPQGLPLHLGRADHRPGEPGGGGGHRRGGADRHPGHLPRPVRRAGRPGPRRHHVLPGVRAARQPRDHGGTGRLLDRHARPGHRPRRGPLHRRPGPELHPAGPQRHHPDPPRARRAGEERGPPRRRRPAARHRGLAAGAVPRRPAGPSPQPQRPGDHTDHLGGRPGGPRRGALRGPGQPQARSRPHRRRLGRLHRTVPERRREPVRRVGRRIQRRVQRRGHRRGPRRG